jgi:glycine/D-amino acid oxidase-like deaminating enzyme
MSGIDPQVYGSSWYAASAVEAPERGRLTFDHDIDVCVVGGGLAGLTVAREVARRGWSVVVLEARRIAWNASGRNCGFVLPGFSEGIKDVVERVGFDAAKTLWALSESGLDYVRDTIRETGMPGVEPVDGWLHVSKIDDGDDMLTQVQLLGEVGAEIEGWPSERVRAVLKTPRYFHAMHYPRAFHIHPLNYALGLAAAAEAAGARIFEDTPVLSIDPSGVRKRIVTPSARLRASKVVLAGNVGLGALMPKISSTLMPITTYLIATAPLGDRLAEAIAYRGAVSDTDWADNHYRILAGGRLMWSGRMTTWERNPRRYVRRHKAAIARLFPQLGKIEIEHAWNGTLGRPIHGMPQIGELQDGVWLASGFSGHGLNTTAMAGELLGRAIVGGDESWRLFSAYELIWAGGVGGRALMQAGYWASYANERIAAHLARRREDTQRREQEQADRRAAEEAAAVDKVVEEARGRPG